MEASKLKPFEVHFPANGRDEEPKFNMKKNKKISKISCN